MERKLLLGSTEWNKNRFLEEEIGRKSDKIAEMALESELYLRLKYKYGVGRMAFC